MDYDFRKRSLPSGGARVSSHPQGTASYLSLNVRPIQQSHSFCHHTSLEPSPMSDIKILLRSDYRLKPPPQLASSSVSIPRSTFHFDFELEQIILADPGKQDECWSKIAHNHAFGKEFTTSGSDGFSNHLVEKFVAAGLQREAVSYAIKNFGDNSFKVEEFVNGYNLLREMGFASKTVAEALTMYDNDTEKVLAHFLSSSS